AWSGHGAAAFRRSTPRRPGPPRSRRWRDRRSTSARRARARAAPARRVRAAAAAPQLVERGVTGDAEQPLPGATAPGVELAPAAQRALERERGDVLRRRAVA